MMKLSNQPKSDQQSPLPHSNVLLERVDKDAKAIVNERDPIYSDTWITMKEEHILFEIEQKVDRIKHMSNNASLCQLTFKYEQALDIINYGRFEAWKILQELLKHQQ